MADLESALAAGGDSSLLRYEAFTRLFALLGRKPDSDTIEIIQTGIGAIEWEKLSDDNRHQLAAHLRHMADHMLPEPAPATAEASPASEPSDPVYDRVSFGEQARLVRVLKEQPAEISLDELLRSLAGKDRDSR